MIWTQLWQSTVFSGVAALLAVALRRNRAGTRYWLWLAASVKFLIPFAALAALGSRLAGPVARPHELRIVVEEISRSFPAPATVLTSPDLVQRPDLLRAILLAVWIAGCGVVAFSWWRRWQRIRRAVRGAVPLDLGVAVPALSSPAMLEPGVFGIFHPVLVLPEGIADRLTPAHLEAIVAHELCHVRRRDNLAAALHMAVEALFWFHPLVWWLGARLVEERERACDEDVLRLGSHPEIYAESILKTCQFYLESPLECMSGISGSDLKERIVRIMTPRVAQELGFGRKLLLIVAGMAALMGPVAFGLVNASQGRAEDRLVVENAPVRLLLQYAYHVNDAQIVGAPSWIDSEHYNIHTDALRRFGPEEDGATRILQELLADRFKLAMHREGKELPIYALVVAAGGPALHQSPGVGGRTKIRHVFRTDGTGDLKADSQSLDQFVAFLAHQLRRSVVNQTGLTGNYDLTLQWRPDGDASGPSLFAAVQEQLGLKLEPQRGLVDTLVIDHIEKPKEN